MRVHKACPRTVFFPQLNVVVGLRFSWPRLCLFVVIVGFLFVDPPPREYGNCSFPIFSHGALFKLRVFFVLAVTVLIVIAGFPFVDPLGMTIATVLVLDGRRTAPQRSASRSFVPHLPQLCAVHLHTND